MHPRNAPLKKAIPLYKVCFSRGNASAHAHAHTHLRVLLMVRIVRSLEPPCSPPGTSKELEGGYLGSHPPCSFRPRTPRAQCGTWVTPAQVRKRGWVSRRGPNYLSWTENGSGRPESAADLGQSPPCSGLSFSTRRLRLTVSIAALAPCGWSFPELGGTPSLPGCPFSVPGLRGRPQKPIIAAGAPG